MFSHRLAWPPRENRLAALLREKRAAGVRLLDLTESNPTRVGFDLEPAVLAAALNDPGLSLYDPDPRGIEPARAAVAAWLHADGPVPRPRVPRQRASADRMILTASTSEAYAFLFKMLCDPGDSILVPAPSYPLFDYLAALEGVEVSTYPLGFEERFRIDLEAIESRLRRPAGRPPRAVVVVNPNNPTGTALATGEREALDRVCAAAGVALIADEVFLDYPWAAPAETTGGLVAGAPPAALTFTLGGLSKGCGMPQMKLGWMLVDGPDGAIEETLERLELIADSYLSVGTPVQRAAERLLDLGAAVGGRIHDRILDNLERLKEMLPAGSPCRLLPADGGWTAVIQVPAIRPEEDLVLSLLRDRDLLVHPGYFFDFPREAFVVVSLLQEPETFAKGVSLLFQGASS